MAVSTSPASAGDTKQPKQSVAAAPAPSFRVELVRISRYSYGAHIYLKSEQYVFDEAGAKHMLGLRDPQELPVFRLAKPRTKMVSVTDDDAVVMLTAPRSPKVDRVFLDIEKYQSGKLPAPVGKIVIQDDDPELEARLAGLDAPEPDLAGAQTL